MAPSHLDPSQSIAEFLSGVHVGPRQAYKSLSVWPLVRHVPASAATPPFVPMADAIEDGTLDVDEVGEEGSVPNVRVSNRGGCAVLMLFGEEIVGAKQNRIANATFLVPARGEVVIDVSCVEAGRWSRPAGQRFRSSDHVISHLMRKKMSLKVAASRARGDRFDADQGEVWEQVGARLGRTHTASPSSSYSDYVEKLRNERDEIDKAFQAMSGQIGFVAAIGDDIQGVEVVGDPQVFARVFRRLLRAYTTDAADLAGLRADSPDQPAALFDGPGPFLRALAEARAEARASLGEGIDLRIAGDRIAGCALVAGGLVHLMAFPR